MKNMTTTFKGTPIRLEGHFPQAGETAPDFRYTSRFGKDYGVLITSGPMRGLLARAVVIIDPKGKVIYSELVSEVTREPNYEAALRAVK